MKNKKHLISLMLIVISVMTITIGTSIEANAGLSDLLTSISNSITYTTRSTTKSSTTRSTTKIDISSAINELSTYTTRSTTKSSTTRSTTKIDVSSAINDLTTYSRSTTQPTTADHTHSYVENEVSIPATPATNGLRTYHCSKCSDIKTETISKIDTVTLSYTSTTYSGSAKKPSVIVKDEEGNIISNSFYTVEYANNKAAGTADVNLTFSGDYAGKVTENFTIKKQAIKEENVTLSYTSTTYSASEKKPTVTVKNSAGTKLGTSYYTVEYENNKSAGKATVTVFMKGNYSGVIEKTFTIKPKALTSDNVTLSYTSTTYSGSAKKPTVTVTNSSGTKLGTKYYTVEYKNNKAAGTATAVVTLKGNYTGVIEKQFTIKPKALTSDNVTISYTSTTYSGSAKKPTVTVKNSSGTKLGTSYYTVSYSNNTNVGKATVKVVLKGNYSGTITKTFNIKPQATTLGTLTATAGGFKATWTKQATQTTGYQLQYATKSDFSDAKTYTSSANTTVSKSVTGLTKGKKYYVRIRTYKTVNSTKYCSAWSASKYVTTK